MCLGGDKYDEQKRLIEELMGSSTGMSDVKKAVCFYSDIRYTNSF